MLTVTTSNSNKRLLFGSIIRNNRKKYDRLLLLLPFSCWSSSTCSNYFVEPSTTKIAAVAAFPASPTLLFPPVSIYSANTNNHRLFATTTSSSSGSSDTDNEKHNKMTSSSEQKHVNYADDSGLTSDLNLSWNTDGQEESPPPNYPQSEPEFECEKLGKPGHIKSFPTGTMEFLPGGTPQDCCGAVEATVTALRKRMSTHPPKILILYGSLSKDSKSRKLAIEAGRILSTYGSSVKLYDPNDLPIFSVDFDAEQVPKAKELRELVMWCEAMVWVSPEIHSNVSSCFKNQIDWIPLSTGAIRPTQGKTVAVMQVEAGSQTFNTVNSMRVLARWMRMVCVPNQSSIPKAYLEFDEKTGEMNDSPLRDRVVDVMDELYKYTILLRDQQPYLLQRYSESKKKANK